MNDFYSSLKGMWHYLLGLGALLFLLGFYNATGRKITGSTGTEKWAPDAAGNHSHGNSHFYHK